MPRRRLPEIGGPVRVEPVLRRGLSRTEAARYVGVSITEFDGLVRDGLMPQPLRIGRNGIWDLRRLDEAFDDLSSKIQGPSREWEASLPSRKPTDQTSVELSKRHKRAAAKPAMSDEYPGHPNIYTLDTLAEYWKCSGTLIRNLIRRGELSALRYGKLLRITVAEVIAYEERNTTRVT